MNKTLNNTSNANIGNFVKNTTESFTEKMIRAKELSEIFIGTSQATYNNWVNSGLITRYKIGGGVYYKLSEIKVLIENSREERRAV